MPARNAAVTSPLVAATPQLGVAWVVMWVSLALHVTDEALTGFLSVYNATVLALREKFGFWPMPTFEFHEWLAYLIAGIAVLALLTPVAFRGVPWIRPVLLFLAVVAGLLNATGHIVGTILGHTVEAVRFSRPAPGFYSSPQ